MTVPTSESEAHGGSGIVVGVDGSALSDAAIGFAFREVSDTEASLIAVLAWSESLAWGVISAAFPTHEDVTSNARHARELLAGWLQPWCEEYPDVVVRHRVVDDIPVRVLATASEGAQLLVVGCRGHGAVRSMILGSVSQGVMHLATCPVAVVHRSVDVAETEITAVIKWGRSTLVRSPARRFHG